MWFDAVNNPTIQKGPHKFHFPHLIILRCPSWSNLLVDFLSQSLLDIRVFGQHIDREGQQAHRLCIIFENTVRKITEETHCISASNKEVNKLKKPLRSYTCVGGRSIPHLSTFEDLRKKSAPRIRNEAQTQPWVCSTRWERRFDASSLSLGIFFSDKPCWCLSKASFIKGSVKSSMTLRSGTILSLLSSVNGHSFPRPVRTAAIIRAWVKALTKLVDGWL